MSSRTAVSPRTLGKFKATKTKAKKVAAPVASKFNSAEVAGQLQKAPRPRQVALKECGNTTYQRKLNVARVKKLFNAFDINRVRSPLLAENPDGGYVVVDGQHTIAVLIQKGFTYWPYAMVSQMSPKEQIVRFIGQKENEQPLKPDEILHAAAQGYNESGGQYVPAFVRAHEIVKGIEDADWYFQPGEKSRSFASTVTISTGVEEVFDEAEARHSGSGQAAVTETLNALQRAYPHDRIIAGDANVHRAFGKLIRAYGSFTESDILTIMGVPNHTYAQLTKGMGAQPQKRDAIAEYLIKALDKRRNKSWYAA